MAARRKEEHMHCMMHTCCCAPPAASICPCHLPRKALAMQGRRTTRAPGCLMVLCCCYWEGALCVLCGDLGFGVKGQNSWIEGGIFTPSGLIGQPFSWFGASRNPLHGVGAAAILRARLRPAASPHNEVLGVAQNAALDRVPPSPGTPPCAEAAAGHDLITRL
jgi:hypothetical protein